MNKLQKEILSEIKKLEIECPECKYIEDKKRNGPIQHRNPLPRNQRNHKGCCFILSIILANTSRAYCALSTA